MKTDTCKLAVLLSGTGSTMVNLHEKIGLGEVPAQICLVVSSRKKALGLERAEDRGIPTAVLTRRRFKHGKKFDEAGYSKALVEIVAPFKPDLIVLAGFMTKISADFLETYNTVNVHPALLPMFGGQGYYGHHVHEAVLEAGVKVTGATVHFVDEKYDHGPIIMQEAIAVLEDDTPDTLANRVQALERQIYPKAVALYAQGLLERRGRRVSVLSGEQAR